MNKATREVRALLKSFPRVRMEADKRGFVLIAPNRERFRVGALAHNKDTKRIESWLSKNS